jgi:DNA-binding SARP family transcriptional activator
MVGSRRASGPTQSFGSPVDAAPGEPIQVTLQAITIVLAQLEQQLRETQTAVGQLNARLDANGGRPIVVVPTDPGPVPRSLRLVEAAREADPNRGLRLFCLGQFAVQLDGDTLPQRSNGKGRAILKYLATRPRQPVLRDVLLEALWPNEDPDIANNRLRVAMHHLRHVSTANPNAEGHDELVTYKDGCYRFNPNVPVWTDVEAFESAWKAGSRAEKHGDVDRAISCFEEAEGLYRGEYFEEDRFEDWLLVKREALKETYLRVLGKLSCHSYQRGAFDTAADGWKKILEKDPWREDVYRNLMICHARRGQRGLALHWFDLCTQVLANELHLQPEPETAGLANRIRQNEEIRDAPEF